MPALVTPASQTTSARVPPMRLTCSARVERAPGPKTMVVGKLQVMLADRFQLKIHRETKNLSVYSLTMGKRSAKLAAAKEDGRSGFRWTPAYVMGQRITMSSLASFLTRQLGQLVVDKTGLEGEFDFTVDFSPVGAAWTMANAAMALPAELGLKLESQKGPVETLVIDHAERPSEN